MLKSLIIKNFIILKDVNLEFKNGFNVLCGETGAGKSIIIKALDVVLGAKVTKEMILDKEKPCVIEALFEKDGIETVISREITIQSKFRLNGALSSLDEIKDLKEKLLDIHSQNQTYFYMRQINHINLLDDYILKKHFEYSELLKTYKQNYFELLNTEKKLEELKKNSENNEREIEFLSFQLKELDDAAVEENEEETLKEELSVLSNIQELKETSYSSYYALYGDNQNMIDVLGKIKHEISALSELDKNLKDVESTLFDAYENLKDSANFLKDYSENLELNPQRLDELNERISLIQKLKRKYGENLDEEYNKIKAQLDNLCSDDNNIEALEENYNNLKQSCDILAESINDYRNKNAKILSDLIEEKLKTLELQEAKFDIEVKKVEKNELGFDRVEFLISTNKNQNPMPLSNVASGGEVSRVMIALKTIFATTDKISTVVFDEIDTGISGVTSNAVAQAMIDLSKNTQIICITHQPIICAKADNFIWIEKSHDNETNVKIEILNDNTRLKALAQLAGGDINTQSIEFAKTLIN